MMWGKRHASGPLALLLSLVAPGCCFGVSHSSESTDTVTVTPPPVDPSLDAIQACFQSLVVDNHCTAPIAVMPAETFELAVCYRTHDLSRFATPGEWLAYVGEGATREVLRRGPSGTTADTQPPGPGETVTWSVHHTMHAPAAGWPVGVPVVFELHDPTGAIVATTSVTFAGTRTSPPLDRPVGTLQLCTDAGLGGPADDPFCTTPGLSFEPGAGHLYATYSSFDPALWAAGVAIVMEHEDAHHAWVEDSRNALDPVEIEPGEVETVKGTWALDAAGWSRHHAWRVRLESNGADVAVAPFTTTH